MTTNLGITIIKSRHSIRKYKDEEIDSSIISDVLECARLAPTARNEQPWLFGVVKDKNLLDKISNLSTHGKFISDAKVCFAIFGKHDAEFYIEDCCAATTQLILALQSYGVGSCWVAGAGKEYAKDIRKLLEVDNAYALVSLVPAGYPQEVSIAQKKELDDITFNDKFIKKD